MTTEAPPQEHIGELLLLDKTGDTRVAWDRRDPDSVAVAKAAFDSAIGKGRWAYSVDPKDANKPGERIRQFDPEAEAIILAPRLVGG